MIIYLVCILLALILWSLWGHFSSRVEQARYEVIDTRMGYEVRRYPAHLVAQTTVHAPYREALNEGFRLVARYIFGGNVRKESIAMTAPVTESVAGETIAMTAPVTASIDSDTRTISFVMPSKYTRESLPEPADPRVHIVEVPEKIMAVYSFSWYATTKRIDALKRAFVEKLKTAGVHIDGPALYAGYNAPWTPPWLMRHEIMVPIQDTSYGLHVSQ